jgi:hypothetical protein
VIPETCARSRMNRRTCDSTTNSNAMATEIASVTR